MVNKKEGNKKKPSSKFTNLIWTCCAISKEKLDENQIVTCCLGYLYNKESVLKLLISKKMGNFYHIKSLNDIYPVHFTLNTAYDKKKDNARFMCPITSKEIQNEFKFIFMKNCGHVISLEAINELKEEKNHCLFCSKDHKDDEKILLNPTKQELIKLKEKLNIKKRKIENLTEETENVKKQKLEKEEKEKETLVVPENANVNLYKSLFKKTSNEKETDFCNAPGMRSLMDL
jgi:hypothetical protein